MQKKYLIIIISLAIVSIASYLLLQSFITVRNCPEPLNNNSIKDTTILETKKVSLNTLQDSGYISANEVLRFMVGNELIDTIGQSDIIESFRYAYSLKMVDGDSSSIYYQYWYHTPSDTIGKYFVMPLTGNYMAALSLGNSVVLLELTSQGELIDYGFGGGHGAYPCCWDSMEDVLKRYNDYFGILSCGTGTAHCSGYLTLFKDKIVTEEKSIPVFLFNGAWGEIPGNILTSTMEFKNDSLVMHYKLEEFTEIEDSENQNTNTIETKIISTDFFTVTYTWGDKGFETDEEHKLEGILK